MIPNQWYAILDSKEVKKGAVTSVRRMGENLVAWRDHEGKAGVARDKCPHRGVALSKGVVRNGHLQCAFHGFEYDATGRCMLIPANGTSSPVPDHIYAKAYPTAEQHGLIYIFWNPAEDFPRPGHHDPGTHPPVPWFDDIDETFAHSGFRDPWATHYSRALENQLDVVHLPFIHHNTIGRGNRTLVNGPAVILKENEIKVYPDNRVDTGGKPLRMDEMPPPDPGRFHIHFLFPNLWQNYLGKNTRLVIAFAPVDEEHSILYLRTYHNFLRKPPLSWLVGWVFAISNRVIAHQDRRVVNTHQPPVSGLRIGENLIPGDFPVVWYRKRREELKGG